MLKKIALIVILFCLAFSNYSISSFASASDETSSYEVSDSEESNNGESFRERLVKLWQNGLLKDVAAFGFDLCIMGVCYADPMKALLIMPIKSFVSNFIGRFGKYFPYFFSNESKKIYDLYEKKFNAEASHLSDEIANVGRNLLAKFSDLIDERTLKNQPLTSSEIKNFTDKFDFYLENAQILSKNHAFPVSRECIGEACEFIETYDKEKQKAFKDFLKQVIQVAKGNLGLRVSPIHLVGAPGTGKTRFAKKLAKILRARFYEVSISKLNGNKDISGAFLEAKGIVLEALSADDGEGIVVLYIDEIDEFFENGFAYRTAFIDLLTTLLDSSKCSLYSHAMGCKVSAKHLIVITSGHKRLPLNKLQDRIITIIMGAIPVEKKQEIYTLKLQKWYNKQNLAFEKSRDPRRLKFSEKEHSLIGELLRYDEKTEGVRAGIFTLKDYMIDEMAQMDPDLRDFGLLDKFDLQFTYKKHSEKLK